MEFEHLFSPLQVGPIAVRNRICETTNSPGAAGPGSGGLIDEHYTAHHLAKARGGTAWIGGETWLLNSPLAEFAEPDFSVGGAALGVTPYLLPGFVEAARAFCNEAHAEKAVVVFQLTHLNNALAPSSIPSTELYDLVPHCMTGEHIEFVMNTYAEAADRARQAGADGVEIHCAHESLPQLFLSPATNKRPDRWGGGPEARSLFIREILRRVRDAVGNDLGIGIRVNGLESRQGGYGLDEFRRMMGFIASTGLLDFLNVDVGHSWGRHAYVPPSYHEPAEHREVSRAIRADLGPDVRVLFAGRVNDPRLAEQLIAHGVCDLVGMTRAGIADPEFANKARTGRYDEIRRCIGCNRCIGESVHSRKPAQAKRPVCSINPEIGREIYWRENFARTSTPRHVVVVGGGAAGLEAARVAALRGHRVTLVERGERVGGQLLLAARAPGRESFEDFIRYSENELHRLGPTVLLGTEATADLVSELRPDVIVCATGSVPRWPLEADVDDNGRLIQGWDALSGNAETGEAVAVYSEEDHFETPSIAEYLAATGRKVTIFHKWAQIGREIDRYSFGTVMKRLEEVGVSVVCGVRLRRVAASRLQFVSAYSGHEQTFAGFDSVVAICGSVPEVGLYHRLRRQMPGTQSYLAGAAWLPRQLAESTQHGASIALSV